MNQIKVTCTDNGKTMTADVLSRNDKSLKVAIVGTTLRLTLSRTDTRKPYVGSSAGLEFTTNG